MLLIPTTSDVLIMQDSENALYQKRLSSALHDLSGPILVAKGFSFELRLARDSALALLASLPPQTDQEVIQSLKEQIDTEMDHCLCRIDESLLKLDATIEGLRIK